MQFKKQRKFALSHSGASKEKGNQELFKTESQTRNQK